MYSKGTILATPCKAVMTNVVPHRRELRTRKWRDEGGVSFRQKLKPTVSMGSRGRVMEKRPLYVLLALAHVASTALVQLQIEDTRTLSPRDLE